MKVDTPIIRCQNTVSCFNRRASSVDRSITFILAVFELVVSGGDFAVHDHLHGCVRVRVVHLLRLPHVFILWLLKYSSPFERVRAGRVRARVASELATIVMPPPSAPNARIVRPPRRSTALAPRAGSRAGIIVFVLFVFSFVIVSVDVVAVVVGKCGGAQEKMA